MTQVRDAMTLVFKGLISQVRDDMTLVFKGLISQLRDAMTLVFKGLISQVRDALSSGNMNLGTRMGSVKSAHRRAGKVKGIERFLGTLETQSQELMETSSGQAFPQIYCI